MPKTINKSYAELIQKAQSLFWIQGYKGTSVNDLAEHLGISTSLIYNKYTKETLFLDSLNYYTSTCSDPFLSELRNSTNGIKGLRDFFFKLIEALESRTFPKSCLMVNTVVEMRNENNEVTKLYDKYFDNLIESYLVVIDKAIENKEIQQKHKRKEYANFLLGVIFGITIIFKISKSKACYQYVEEQLKLIH